MPDEDLSRSAQRPETRMANNTLWSAIQQALQTTGVPAALALGVVTMPAVAQDSGGNPPAPPQTLETIVVTGSHVRRVDLETSNPIVAISSQQIQATGKLTLGDVVQQLPVITGGIQNPSVNNGGGSGQTLVGLRGLGSSRTLVLVDGQRVLSGGATAAGGGIGAGVDLNTIPAAAVERIEVLTDGASAIYGSDAIGGVINIILKSNYQGAEFQANYGISDRGDGARRGASFTFGQTSDKGSILAGVDYNKFDPVLQSQRKFSENAVSLSASNTYGGPGTAPAGLTYLAVPGSGVSAIIGGSSFAARNKIIFTTAGPGTGSFAAPYNCGNGQLSLNPDAAASGKSPVTPADYHCFGSDPALSDKYNYASVNLILTPQERTNAFFKGVYHLADNLDFYGTAYHQKSTSASQLAPAVMGSGPNFDTGFRISKDNYYNPFGVDFAGPEGNTYTARLFPAGNRYFATGITYDQLVAGFKGSVDIGQQNWQWDVGYNYGHMSQIVTNNGLPDQNILNLAAGPSFLNADGVVQCGTAAAPIPLDDCTPFDPFNLFNANTQAVIRAAASPALINFWNQERTIHADINGGLFDLPAGTVQVAAGVSHRKEYTNNVVGNTLLLNPATGTCTLGSACSAHLQGGYNVKEAYAEILVPLLKDMPFVNALNVTLGDRWSKYSTFGSTNNWKIGVEYRPIEDLLLRGTVSTVFRAPTIGNVFGPPISSAPLLSADPCDHITVANPACANVPLDGSFVDRAVAAAQQLKAITSGSTYAGFPLGPESGKSFDFGAVYSPHFLPGLSASADIWRIYLDNVITVVGAQSVVNLCFAGQTRFCPLITRAATPGNEGQIALLTLPTANLGRFDVKGVDFQANYKLPPFAFGQFSVGLSGTYLAQAKVQSAPGLPGNSVLNYVGIMGSTGSALQASCPGGAPGAICYFPRVRGLGSLGWQWGPWDAQWTMNYISHFQVGSLDARQGATGAIGFAPGGPAGAYVLEYGNYVYNNLQLGYSIQPINLRLDAGVDNVFDKQPPFLYANNSQNANTDPNDFDVLGRYYWARLTMKF
jgi:outer membrane receptor protein involved in Fe transport